MKRLSIIIVTYKSENDIYDCLLSIWKFCDIPQEELEVIIVDNSPKCEPMFHHLREKYGNNIILIHNTHNGGYGQGNNVGIRMATAPTIMIMNPDVRLCEPIFKTVLTAFEQDAKLCMYGMKQMLAKGIYSPLSFDCSRHVFGGFIPVITTICNKINWYIPSIMYLQGSCFFICKRKFEQVGLFDERIFMYGEEDDIHFRFKKQYGPFFRFNKRLHYLHLTLKRPMSLSIEKKMVESIILSNQKKGINAKQTIRNYIYYYQVRLVSSYIKKYLMGEKNQEHISILKDIINSLKKQMK